MLASSRESFSLTKMIEWLILFLGIPAGYLIAWLASDELKIGRKWFRALVIIGFFGGIWFWLTGYKTEAFSMGFILIVSLVSLVKS
jgi:hypothetical protein